MAIVVLQQQMPVFLHTCQLCHKRPILIHKGMIALPTIETRQILRTHILCYELTKLGEDLIQQLRAIRLMLADLPQ